MLAEQRKQRTHIHIHMKRSELVSEWMNSELWHHHFDSSSGERFYFILPFFLFGWVMLTNCHIHLLVLSLFLLVIQFVVVCVFVYLFRPA